MIKLTLQQKQIKVVNNNKQVKINTTIKNKLTAQVPQEQQQCSQTTLVWASNNW